ncbi:hypothetical protein TL16_g03931 [Triparma laevis f. inornata]|uniref:Protein kinase domain-containing protein n=1 Tax=Triparma laevis f. inornata TaxID=1714386 RepID=A0A9W7A1Q5_9STRA|nr:hypothetical protein TL16_g03931 [Triparma laevis f. inornata]
MQLDSPQTSIDTDTASTLSPKTVHTTSSSTAVSQISSARSTSTSGSRPHLSSYTSHDGHKTIVDGRFIVLETLGSGATGKVKLGIDTTTGERVALKIMGKRATSKRQADQNRREIEAMTTIHHPNVLCLSHVELELKYPKSDGTFKDCILLVIELASGGELFDFMMYTGAFEETIAKIYTRHLLSALVTCHANQIYHRDLKPENLLLDEHYQLKIADFGYSAIQNQYDAANGALLHTECGTRSYMAPEILTHQPYNGTAADTWSAGVVIFIMITGNPPFQLATRSDWWFNAIATGNVDRFWRAHMRSAPNISPEARSFLELMLKPEASDRATLRQLLEHEWLNEMSDMSHDDLYNLMDDRKRKVDAAKNHEREKAKQAAAAARAQGQYDPFKDQHRVRRGAGQETEDTSLANLPPLKNTTKTVHTKLYIPDAFGEGAGDRVARTVDGLKNLFETLKFNSVTVAKNKVKGIASEDLGKVEVAVKLFCDADQLVAEVNRKGGDIFDFRKAFNKIRELVEGKEEETAEPEDDLAGEEGGEPIDMI